jgi:hypothetical protein
VQHSKIDAGGELSNLCASSGPPDVSSYAPVEALGRLSILALMNPG